MNRQSNVSKEEWPDWSITPTSLPLITLEGQNLQFLFSMIHLQLEILHSNQIEQNKIIIENNKKDEKNNDKNYNLISKLLERIEILEKNHINHGTDELIERLKLAEERIEFLEKQLQLRNLLQFKILYNKIEMKSKKMNKIYKN